MEACRGVCHAGGMTRTVCAVVIERRLRCEAGPPVAPEVTAVPTWRAVRSK